ncbi:MAG: hypothetical protein IID15_07385 [Candidatus Marinimicrobia bacterium]|nr:hypothetical protein [Candidatus Neomarinimicrobiota bacterium]
MYPRLNSCAALAWYPLVGLLIGLALLLLDRGLERLLPPQPTAVLEVAVLALLPQVGTGPQVPFPGRAISL